MGIFLALICVAGLIAGGSTQCAVNNQAGGVICVAKEYFVLNYQDPKVDTPIKCPEGSVCAESTDICSTTVDPLCRNLVPGTSNYCNDCAGANNGSPICINDTAYSLCTDNKVSTIIIQLCKSPKPYCKINPGVSICTNDTTLLDCGGPSDGGSDGGSGKFTCQEAGFFPDPTDPTCVKYFKCQQNIAGGLDQLSYSCQAIGYAFNPAQSRCVAASTFTCPYA